VRGEVPNARRFLALGRDVESEFDAALLDANTAGFKNEGDNEPTGLFASDGGIRVQDLVGKPQNPVQARWFFTQQHGKNVVYEILPVKK